MEDIRSIIWEILESPSEDNKTTPPKMEMVEAFEDVEFEDIFTDLFISVKNVDDFYNSEVDSRATNLLESFLLESLVLLKQNPEVTLVVSSPDYVKATAYTPEGDSAAFMLDDAVKINTMLEIYNNALSENDMPQIEAGIGIASYQTESEDCHCHSGGCHCEEESEESSCCGEACECGEECDCDDDCDCGDECDCENHDSEDLISNQDDTAERLSEIANSDEFDPIVMNEGFYGLISDLESEKSFIDTNFQKVTLETDEMVVFHGNIVLEE